MDSMRDAALLAGRVLIAAVFVYDATIIARFPDATIGYMEQFGLPGMLLWPTALFQLAAGILVVVGWQTRLAALAFAGFCLATALIFHRNFADTTEAIQFGKDVGLAGGFLFLAAAGAGRWSLDAQRATAI